MKRCNVVFFLTIILLMGWISTASAQGRMGRIGKIFQKAEAATLFGDVKEQHVISKAELRKFLLKTGPYLLINLKNKKLILADERRKSINSTDNLLTSRFEALNIFSKEVVAEFLNMSEDESVIIESRAEVLTLSSGAYTLEFSATCPPVCFD